MNCDKMKSRDQLYDDWLTGCDDEDQTPEQDVDAMIDKLKDKEDA